MGTKTTYYTRSPETPMEYLVPLVISKAAVQKLSPAERKQFKPLPDRKPAKNGK